MQKEFHISRTGRVLGSGAKGVVHLAFNEDTGEFIAIKELNFAVVDGDPESEATAREIHNEVQLMQRALHPNLVKYVGVRQNEHGKVELLMEYVSGGSLGSLIRKQQQQQQRAGGGGLRESVVRLYTRDIVRGLAYLHDVCHACHRDIKPDNVLITPEGRCKLADFGASRTIEHQNASSAQLKTCVGTAYYMAPEVVQGGGYDTSADIWSLGATVFEMVTGSPPYVEITNPLAVMFRVATQGCIPSLPTTTQISNELRDFIAQCTRTDRRERPTAAALLEHPFIRVVVDSGADGGEASSGGIANRPGLPAATAANAATTTADTTATPSQNNASQSPRSQQQQKPAAAASPAPPPPPPPPATTSSTEDVDFPFFVQKTEAVEAWRLCQRCQLGFALFHCDACAALGLEHHRFCAPCWAAAHAHQRSVSHVKRPLLTAGGGGGGVSSLQQQQEGATSGSFHHQQGDGAAPVVASPSLTGLPPPNTSTTRSADSGPRQQQPQQQSAHHHTSYDNGSILLSDGTFVDLFCAGEQSEWTCGRCGTLNDGPATECTICSYKR